MKDSPVEDRDCIASQPEDNKKDQRLATRIIKERIPLNGSFALTHRCNLRCQHCYLGSQDIIRKHKREELTTQEIFDIIDQLVAAQTLTLIFTGGEVLLRKDFADIYLYTLKQGIIVSFMTNGTLLNDDHIDIFKKHRPKGIDITMYGATKDTYETITGVPGSYEKFTAALEKLYQNKIYFSLKTVLMSTNKHELELIEKKANEYGVKFRYDSGIFPCLHHPDNTCSSDPESIEMICNKPLNYRVSPEEIVEIDFATPDRIDKILKGYNKGKQAKLSTKLFNCGAGLTGFHIDPYGNLVCCVTSVKPKYNLRQGNFMDGWNTTIARVRQRDAGPGYQCNTCKARPVCIGCAAIFEAETGNEKEVSSYICNTSRLRYERIREHLHEHENNDIS